MLLSCAPGVNRDDEVVVFSDGSVYRVEHKFGVIYCFRPIKPEYIKRANKLLSGPKQPTTNKGQNSEENE